MDMYSTTEKGISPTMGSFVKSEIIFVLQKTQQL